MPAAKPKSKRPPAKAGARASATTAKAKVLKAKVVAKTETPKLNGIPLRRRSVWTVDTDSPQFQAARRRDALTLATAGEDGSLQILDALLNDKDVQKWWN
jgi:hypothetical protein